MITITADTPFIEPPSWALFERWSVEEWQARTGMLDEKTFWIYDQHGALVSLYRRD